MCLQNEFYASLTQQTGNHGGGGGGMNSAVLPKYAVKYDVFYVNYILFCCMKYICAYIHVHTLSLYFIVLCNRLSVLLFLFLCTGKLFLLQQIIF